MQHEIDTRYMQQALQLAARGVGHTHPNPVVGCVIVEAVPQKPDQISPNMGWRVIGKGYHQKAGEPHAEILALNALSQPDQSQGATLYVTLEPCSHQGRTPPCADALIRAGVARVVVAMLDPNPQVSGQGVERLRHAGITVTVGVCAEKAKQLNKPFITWIRQHRPMVTVKMAASLDGKTATRTGESQWITGPRAREHVQKMRAKHDVVMVGIGTVLADNPRLNCRLATGQNRLAARDPIRLVVDSSLKIPLDAAILTSSPTAPLWVACTERAKYTTRTALEKQGVKILLCGQTAKGRVDLNELMNQLGSLGILSVLSEAGSTLSAALFDDGLVDQLALFLAPKLIGGDQAAGLLGGEGINLLTNAHHLTKLNVTTVGEDLLLEGELIKKCSPG